jgi:hypothetical protein
MQKSGHFFFAALVGALLTFLLLWGVFARPAQAQQPAAAGSDEIPPAGGAPRVPVGPLVLPTPIPGEALVYFFPSDSDATATVLNLLNTDSVAHTVALRGYSSDGVLVYSANIVIPAASMQRVMTDSVAASPPPSWTSPVPYLANLTDYVYFASLSLPKGVKADGYTLFNAGTGTIDPRADQGSVPLRFSADPASIFLPAVQ